MERIVVRRSTFVNQTLKALDDIELALSNAKFIADYFETVTNELHKVRSDLYDPVCQYLIIAKTSTWMKDRLEKARHFVRMIERVCNDICILEHSASGHSTLKEVDLMTAFDITELTRLTNEGKKLVQLDNGELYLVVKERLEAAEKLE